MKATPQQDPVINQTIHPVILTTNKYLPQQIIKHNVQILLKIRFRNVYNCYKLSCISHQT